MQDANWGTTCTPIPPLAPDGKMRKELEAKSGKPVLSRANYLSQAGAAAGNAIESPAEGKLGQLPSPKPEGKA
jgi:hypothetical protein